MDVPLERELLERESLEQLEYVTSGWMLFGEYDLIARVQAEDEYDLTRCIVEEIRPRAETFIMSVFWMSFG